MRVPLYQVDAFAARLFTGNPAAVCPLPRWLPDDVLQAVAAENNLSETAFLVPEGDHYKLRWMTPTVEVDLCGHATLAAGFVLLEVLETKQQAVSFETRSGRLTVTREDGLLWLDFPALPVLGPARDAGAVAAALGVTPRAVYEIRQVHHGRYLLAELADEAEVVGLNPDVVALRGQRTNVIVTAPGDEVDFVSRFFAPASGIDEDPVTGSAHCTLTPFWAARLGKTGLRARQRSRRGGELHCQLRGDRVKIGGRAVLYLRGEIEVPETP